MVFTEQQLQVKKLVDVQQDIEIDALNDGVGALSSTMQNGFTEAANNFSDIQNSLGLMNSLSDERYNGLTGSINALSNAMTQGFLDMGNTIVNTTETIQGQFNDVNNTIVNTNMGIQNQLNDVNANIASSIDNYNVNIQNQFNNVNYTFEQVNNDVATAIYNIWDTCNNMNASIANSVTTNLLTANNIVIDVSAAPVNSTAALGYDINGKIIPITTIVNTNITFPPNADYLYTDGAGTAFAGSFNDFNNSFNDIQNSFNLVDDTFAGVQNQFNDVNNTIDSFYFTVSNGFNDISNEFNNYNNQFNDVNNNFNGVQNQFNEVGVSIEDYINMTKSRMLEQEVDYTVGWAATGVNTQEQYHTNLVFADTSQFPSGSQNVYEKNWHSLSKGSTDIATVCNYMPGNSSNATPGNVYIKYGSTLPLPKNLLEAIAINNIIKTSTNTQAFYYNGSFAKGLFAFDSSLHTVPENLFNYNKVLYTAGAFKYCTNLESYNRDRLSNIVNGAEMFNNCYNMELKSDTGWRQLNLNIDNGAMMFYNCNNLNISTAVITARFNDSDIGGIFRNAFVNTIELRGRFSNTAGIAWTRNIIFNNAYIDIRKVLLTSHKDALEKVNGNLLSNNVYGLFNGCTNLVNVEKLNMPYATTLISVFNGCTSLNSNFKFPENGHLRCDYMFRNCTSFNAPINIPFDQFFYGVNMFANCSSLNQDIYLHQTPGSILADIRYSPYFPDMFKGCELLQSKNIHIPSSIPLETSNILYNYLVNNYTGINWTGRIYNDL